MLYISHPGPEYETVKLSINVSLSQSKKNKSKSQKQRVEWWLPGAEKRRKDSMLVKGTIFQLEDKLWGSNVQQDFPESARGKESACQCKRLKR